MASAQNPNYDASNKPKKIICIASIKCNYVAILNKNISLFLVFLYERYTAHRGIDLRKVP